MKGVRRNEALQHTIMAFQFIMPRRSFIGKGAVDQAGEEIKQLGSKALIVSGKHVTAAGIVKQLTDRLDSWGIEHILFNDIPGEPTDKMIEEGLAAFREGGCDFIIGIGGGSPLDSAKAIAAMNTLGGRISDLMGVEIKGDFVPCVLIPTTAGTGSEATKFTIITDTENDVKMLLKGNDLMPDIAVVDPEFTLSTPKGVTIATGMDALTHAIESYTSRKANALTDLYAISAIKRIFRSLPKAAADGSDVSAREEMAIAAFEAGVCINNASVTIVHGMSRPIGALFHVSHGLSNAILLNECMKFAVDGCPEKFAEIARAIGVASAEADDAAASEAFLKALDELCRTLNISTLADCGVEKEAFLAAADKMADDALASGSPANTVKEVKKEDILEIYRKLF